MKLYYEGEGGESVSHVKCLKFLVIVREIDREIAETLSYHGLRINRGRKFGKLAFKRHRDRGIILARLRSLLP